MPIHDWTRVGAGIFHAFRVHWLTAVCDRLNTRELPADSYAIPEQDVVRYDAEMVPARWIAVKRTRGDETVAVIELVSPGNKGSRHAFRAFVRKSVDLIERRVHLLVVDLFPPTLRDRHGMHAAIWGELTGRRFEPPADEPLTLASYEAGAAVRAFVEPTAVGRPLPDMPLFLEPGQFVTMPLAATYRTAWDVFPARWREELEPG